MLKSLIGHWKAHKRKPSLLPEDGIILHPEDPPRINPIFEDSDGSLTSSHRGPDSIELDAEQNITLESQKNIHLDLVDISIPVQAEEDDPKSDNEENPDDVINQIDIAIDSSLSKEEKLESLEREIQEAILQSNEGNINAISEAISKEDVIKLKKETEIVPDETSLAVLSETRTKSEPSSEVVEPISKDNHQKEKSSDMTPRTEDSAIPSTSKGIKSETNKHSKEMELPTPNLVAEQKMVKNIKTRAIDELIKKFQGNTSGNDPAIQTIPSFLHSPNRKSILKTKTFEQNNDTEIPPVYNGQQKESLSKIFNFPPPPPIEPSLNSKQFAKNGKKETITSISKSPSNASRNAAPMEGKTRSDSSLTRNKTVSSSISKPSSKTNEIKIDSSVNNVPLNEPIKVIRTEQSNASPVEEPITKIERHHKETASSAEKVPDSKAEYSTIEGDETMVKELVESNLQSKPSTSFTTNQSSNENITTSKQNSEKQTLIPNKSSLFNSSRSPKLTIAKSVHESATPVTKLSDSSVVPDTLTSATKAKPVPDVATSIKDTESPKSNAEDSGITRGDQVSSEESPEIPLPHDDPQKHDEVIPPTPAKRNLKGRRSLKHRHKGCRHCKKSHDDATPLNIGQYDDYYDLLTGARRSSRAKPSGSWASDLSFEEKELIRRLRSRRDTIRSNATSTKSRQSNYQDGNFHRHNPIRRSMSENSILNEPSMCSCDQCYMILVKDYAYSRASLRGMAPNKVIIICVSLMCGALVYWEH